MPKRNRYLSKMMVCELFDISPARLYRLVREGLLPEPVRLDGETRWSEAELDAAAADLPRGITVYRRRDPSPVATARD